MDHVDELARSFLQVQYVIKATAIHSLSSSRCRPLWSQPRRGAGRGRRSRPGAEQAKGIRAALTVVRPCTDAVRCRTPDMLGRMRGEKQGCAVVVVEATDR